jgi:opacity protein-like surface antigen
MRKFLIAAAMALLTVSSAIAADGLRVVDGDTINIDGMPIRISADEHAQTWSPRCQQSWAGMAHPNGSKSYSM